MQSNNFSFAKPFNYSTLRVYKMIQEVWHFMKRPLILILITILLASVTATYGQKNRSRQKPKTTKTTKKEEGNPATVVDRRLAVLRTRPSLYGKPIQRMKVGREVLVLDQKDADGVTFYQVKALPNTIGWVQSEAVIGSFRKDDDQRLAKLIQAADGFDQVDKTVIFLEIYPKSPLRPAILLLLGDLMEEEAISLTERATRSLDRREMAASGAPLHSFYLNFPSLDRFGKIGIRFLFNVSTKSYHYDGDSWFEIVRQFPKSSEAAEAQKRLDALRENMEIKK